MEQASRARWVDGFDHRAWLANQLALQLRFGRRTHRAPHIPRPACAHLSGVGELRDRLVSMFSTFIISRPRAGSGVEASAPCRARPARFPPSC